MSAHDRWLANYRHRVMEARCENVDCPNHEDVVVVDYEEEYGQGWFQPDECPKCNGPLTLDGDAEPPE